MRIKNALVFDENNGFVNRDICIQASRFVESDTDGEVFDASGYYAIPGLIDLHFHGCMGHDFCEGTQEATSAIASYQASQGVCGICPATMTLPEEQLLEISRTAKKFCPTDREAFLYGMHMEGPFLSQAKKGAQNGAYLHMPDKDLYDRLQQASGHLYKIVSIAPEVEGAIDFIQQVRGDAVLSVAHTTADYEQTRIAFAAGASHITHFYNAMTPFSHREPGAVGAAFEDASCKAELICDGVHVHPSAIRTAMRILGSDRVVFISDSMMATGMLDGQYELGGQDVFVRGKLATLKDGTIAGSATNLMDCVRTAVKEMEIPLETAVKCASVNPAKELGIFDCCGSITVGKQADLVLLDQSLNLKAVYLRGKNITR